MVSASGTKQIDGQTATWSSAWSSGRERARLAAKDRALKAQNAKKHSRALGRHRAGLGQRERDPALQPGRSAGLGAERLWWPRSRAGTTPARGSVSSTEARRPLARRWVPGCPGGQQFDGQNGVGWAALDEGTLGVTVYSTSIDEADMGINTGYAWNLGCQELSTSFDLQTVLLHENGHVVGLDHSSDTNAIMYPSYQQADCTLGTDDVNGIRAIYP